MGVKEATAPVSHIASQPNGQGYEPPGTDADTSAVIISVPYSVVVAYFPGKVPQFYGTITADLYYAVIAAILKVD